MGRRDERTSRTLVPASAARWAGACPLLDERVGGIGLAAAPFGTLRALRRRAGVLDEHGRALVERTAVEVEDPAEAALAVELADELRLDVRPRAGARLLDRLDAGCPPDRAAPLVYVLLTDWRLP